MDEPRGMMAARTACLTRKIGWGFAGPHAYVAKITMCSLSGSPGRVITAIKCSIGVVSTLKRVGRQSNLRKIESVGGQVFGGAD